MTEPPGTADLVGRIQAGETAAGEQLVERYKRGISVIVRRCVGRRADAEDLEQETFRLAIEKIRGGELRDPDRLSGFICGLARNLAIGYLRRESRSLPAGDYDAGETAVMQAPAGQLDALLEKEKAALIRQVLAEMTDRDRQVLCRFYLREEDKESICSRLQLSSLHFNRVLYRARERYRTLFEKKITK